MPESCKKLDSEGIQPFTYEPLLFTTLGWESLGRTKWDTPLTRSGPK